MNRLLMPVRESRGTVPEPGGYHLETAFHSRGRLYPAGLNASFRQRLADHYAHLIRRRPQDLDTHIRRIFLLQGLQRRHSLLGAIIDLFITLDGKGNALREDLLARLSGSLSRQQMDILSTWAARGARAEHSPCADTSLLQLPASDAGHPVRPAGKRDEGGGDALAEAREYLQHGQVEDARDLLEAALLQRPADDMLADELLAIYRHAREPARLQSLEEQLRERGSRLPESAQWRETLRFLRAGTEA